MDALLRGATMHVRHVTAMPIRIVRTASIRRHLQYIVALLEGGTEDARNEG